MARRRGNSAPTMRRLALETRDRLHKALAQLPPNYRMLVIAHYLAGCSTTRWPRRSVCRSAR